MTRDVARRSYHGSLIQGGRLGIFRLQQLQLRGGAVWVESASSEDPKRDTGRPAPCAGFADASGRLCAQAARLLLSLSMIAESRARFAASLTCRTLVSRSPRTLFNFHAAGPSSITSLASDSAL